MPLTIAWRISYPEDEQLAILDELAAVNFKVLYELPQMDYCNTFQSPYPETSCDLRHNTSSPAYQLLNTSVHLVKGHPALLGYCASPNAMFQDQGAFHGLMDLQLPFGHVVLTSALFTIVDICDDCCKNSRGATLMAQAYNIIKTIDPYHIISGASDCTGTFVFGDGHASCLGWQNEQDFGPTNCPVTGCVCEKPSTTNTTLPVIPYGDQPHQQLSLDYVLNENYEGGLWRHSGDGHWGQGFFGPDGPDHAANPFEPIANCPQKGGSKSIHKQSIDLDCL